MSSANSTKDDAPGGDERVIALAEWLRGLEVPAAHSIRAASSDASTRRYFRVSAGEATFIAMDAPGERASCERFVRIAGTLQSMGLNAPTVLAANLEEGFLLLTDLGAVQYLDRITEDPATIPQLYPDALASLQRLQDRGRDFRTELPAYDEELLRFELSLFQTWLCEEQLGIALTTPEEAMWRAVCDLLVDSALRQPRVFVHRDFHSRNLMVTNENNPGILDFQDALDGPLTYDLVSLLKDCYVRLPSARVHEWVVAFHSSLDTAVRAQADEELFFRYFQLMGVQRHLKAAGIFARLNLRDGKPGYLADIPRTLGYIVELGPEYPELRNLSEFIGARCLPALEAAA